MRTILVPLTLSDHSRAALPIALRLAREAEANIVLLHLVPAIVKKSPNGPMHCDVAVQLRRVAEIELNQLASEISPQVPVEVVICEGRPAEMIVQQADALGADVIVMCSHGYHGWLKWLHRNTALQVLRHAPCGVWLVSPGKNETVTLTMAHPPGECAEPFLPAMAHPFLSLLNILFPAFRTTQPAGRRRKLFTLNFSVKPLR